MVTYKADYGPETVVIEEESVSALIEAVKEWLAFYATRFPKGG